MADRFTLKRSPDKPEKSEPPRSAAAAAERIAVIIEAAERAASGVIDDAENQARRYMKDSQRHADRLVAERLDALSELTESLAVQAETVKRHADRLIGALEEVRSQVEGGERLGSAQSRRSGAVESVEPEEASASHPFPAHLQPVESPRREEASLARSSNDSPEARLLATQMAISGSSRTEIDACLRNELGVEDPAPLLDAILGLEA